MPRKKSKNKILKNKFNLKILLTILPVLLLFGISLSGYVWYQSRSLPDEGEEHQITVLPTEFQHVLGAKTSSQSTKEIQIKIPIFLYHYVENVYNDPGRQKLNIPPSILTAQIETLKRAGYTLITPDDLIAALSGKKKLSQKLAMLTFDDGYMDFYTDVFPILHKEQVKAIAYIVP